MPLRASDMRVGRATAGVTATMRTGFAGAMVLGLVIAGAGLPVAPAATRKPQPHDDAGRPATAHGTRTQLSKRARPKFRPAQRAAAQEAARLGAAVGPECHGKADMPRNEHQWVVLCSNGKTYVVDPPAAAHAGVPAVECSLAGGGPEPACFEE